MKNTCAIESVNSGYEELGCQECRSPIKLEGATAGCTGCGKQFAVEDGVLCTDRSDCFMGEFDAIRMREFTQNARDIGWRRVVQEHMTEEDLSTQTILLDSYRASFINLLKMEKMNSVLDLGAGMGAISQQLSKCFDRVYAMDLTFERLAFLNVVAEQEKNDGIQTICHRDIFNLPFKSDSLDAVVMMGVFEYFPLSYPNKLLAEVQSRALSELQRVIAPGGLLFIGTKNRFGWPYFAGAVDNSQLRFGSLMPRWFANVASKFILREPYRVITDSYMGYNSLLDKAGFDVHKVYWPVDGYQKSKSWVDLSDKEATRNALKCAKMSGTKKRLLSVFLNMGAFKYLVPHFGILARKGG